MNDKLLILDDELLILTSLEHLFEEAYQVFTTADAITALGLALEHDIAVILCDERMPGVSGHEFLRRVREVSSATRVMMSGYADMSALTEAVNSGQIFAYVAKPWEPLKLKDQVAAAVVHSRLVKEIEQERGLLRALMENIPDSIYFKDCQSRFTRVNQAHARYLGAKDTTECIGKSNSDYFKSEDALRWRLSEEEIIESGQPQLDQIEQVEDASGLRWWSTTKVPMFDRSGQVSGIAGISRDVTPLKNSEERLREQNEHNRMILESAYDAFIGMDPDGSITAWNPQAALTFGWTAAEVIGRRLCDTIIAPAYRGAHAHGVERFLMTAQGSLLRQPIELMAVHRDGHELPVEATVWPVRVGGATSFNAFVRDISERRRAEQARMKETNLIDLLQSVTVAANRSSSIEHTARVCLERICSHIGWQVGHVYLRANEPPGDLISAGFWQTGEESQYAAFREAGDRVRFPNEAGLPDCVLASGKSQWIVNLADEDPLSERTRVAVAAGLRSGFGFPVTVEDKIIGVLEFFSVQTAQPDEEFLSMMAHVGTQLGQVIIRQRAKEDLQLAKASAESANRAKSEFLTTMSHEMRTPMNAILGMADLLSESALDEEQRDYVCIFQKAGANLLDLINDILDLSKVESGHFQLESIRFDLRALLERIIEMMASRARDRRLDLTLVVMPDVPATVVGDPNRLRQILLNLVGNALKFTEQGSVTLRVERDRGLTSGEGAAEWLRFNVIDTGIGIAADKAEMIFERFTQADSSTTRKYGGSGLGLAISKGLVELMGGRIACSSDIGKGSTFSIAVPFAIRKEMESSEAARPPARGNLPVRRAGVEPGSRILIAEDSEYNLLLTKAYLKDCGFLLDFAANGQIAVQKAMSGNHDLVLMDLEMPVMDGLEATRAIRSWEAKTHAPPIPILALTAHAEGEGVGRSLESGCTEHHTKPIRKATLLEAIDRHISGKIRITPPEGIEGLVPNYLANVRRDMDAILAAVDSRDCMVARRLGHQFKGSGEGYGIPEITRAGAALELAALATNENEIRSQILSLATYLDRIEIAV